MKKKLLRRAETRKAILDALAEIVGTSGGDFSVQQVADRAGVTHRTVYNHFPTREALNEGLADHVEELLAATHEPPDRKKITAANMTDIAAEAFARFDNRPAPVRAYVLFQLSSRRAAGVARRRTDSIRKAIEEVGPLQAPVSSKAVAAAVRMFLSAKGWHLLTEHYGLTSKEATATATWAAKAILKAATGKNL